MIEDVSIEAPLGKSHHAALVYSFMCYSNNCKATFEKPVYNKGDYDKFRDTMNEYDWGNDFDERTCEECWDLFVSRINIGVAEFVPKKLSSQGKPGRPVWMNPTALVKVKKKRAKRTKDI